MTCIIGGKCSDGVVLVADKKTKEDNGMVCFEEKLFIFQKANFYYPIVIGGSGTIALYKKFKEEAIVELEKIIPVRISFSYKSFSDKSFNVSGRIYPLSYTLQDDTSNEIILDPYIRKLELITQKYKRDYSSQPFDVLFAAQVQHRGAVLFHIPKDGLSEDYFNIHYHL